MSMPSAIGSLRRRGLLGTLKWALVVARDRFEARSPWSQFVQQRRREAEADFDEKHGVDTVGVTELKELHIDAKTRAAGAKYQGSVPTATRSVIETLGIDYPAYTFLDFGSGKGRVLLIAAEFPFQHVKGVEFARELHDRAERNIREDRMAQRRRCRKVESILADAAEFPIPESNVIVYMFNPFCEYVVDRILSNLRSSYLAHPRDIRVVYLNYFKAHHADLFARHGLRETSRKRVSWGRGFRVYTMGS